MNGEPLRAGKVEELKGEIAREIQARLKETQTQAQAGTSTSAFVEQREFKSRVEREFRADDASRELAGFEAREAQLRAHLAAERQEFLEQQKRWVEERLYLEEEIK